MHSNSILDSVANLFYRVSIVSAILNCSVLLLLNDKLLYETDHSAHVTCIVFTCSDNWTWNQSYLLPRLVPYRQFLTV